MEALEFVKEEIRFCREQEGCSNCEVSSYCSFLNRPRNLINDCAERRVSIIEDWSKKHPIITNAQKFREVFGFNGNTVNKVKPEIGIAGTKGSCGYDDCRESCGSRNFPRCPMWWDDEYKEPEHENE